MFMILFAKDNLKKVIQCVYMYMNVINPKFPSTPILIDMNTQVIISGGFEPGQVLGPWSFAVNRPIS